MTHYAKMTPQETDAAVARLTHGTRQGTVALQQIRGEASVNVQIVASRWAFGRIDVLVTPIAGEGSWWIDLERLQPQEGEK